MRKNLKKNPFAYILKNMSQPTMVDETCPVLYYYLILYVFYVIFDTEEKVLEKILFSHIITNFLIYVTQHIICK